MRFLPSVSLLFLTIALCNSSTYEDRYLPGNALRISWDVDWMGCLQICHGEPKCISYNYHKDKKICKINSDEERGGCGTEKTIVSTGWIYHQMRPTPKERVTKYELGDDPSQAAKSCQEIFNNRSKASSRAYYIKLASKISLIYCKMVPRNSEEEPCTWGGWTLAMKLDGRLARFSYSNVLWSTEKTYNEDTGKDLNQTETKLDAFNKLTLDHGFCVGMKVNGITKWLEIRKKSDGESALARFVKHGDDHTIEDREKWTSLINGSFVNETCSHAVTTEQGFNLNKYAAKARLGMVTLCNNNPVSIIGFGMSKNTSCGIIDMRSGKSIKAFCFILVK